MKNALKILRDGVAALRRGGETIGFYPTDLPYKSRYRTVEEDRANLANDWKNIGGDMRKAVLRYGKSNEED